MIRIIGEYLIKAFLFFFFVNLFQVNAQEYEPHIIEGLYAFEKGDIKRSERIFRRLLKKYPGNSIFLYNMGNIELVKKRYKSSIRYYQKVIDQKSNLTPAARIYMSQAKDALGDYRMAVELLGKALNSKLSDSLYNLAMDEVDLYKEYEEEFLKKANHQFKKKDYDKAFHNYWLAWVLNPTSETNFKIGHTLLLQNKLKEAEKYFYKIKDDEIFNKAEDLMYEYGILKHVQITDHKRISLYFDYSSGSNSNPNTQASSESFNSDSETVMAYGGDYSYYIKNRFSAKIGFEGYSDTFKSDLDTKSTGFGFVAPVSYKTENYDISLSPKREKTTYGGSDYVQNTSLSFNYLYYFSSSKTSLTLSHTSYSALTNDYDYLSGKGQVFEANHTFLLGTFDLSLGLSLGRERLNDSDSSISSNDNRAFDLAVYFPLADRISLDFNTNYQISNYLADSSSFSQKDTTWTNYITLTLALRDYLSIYLRERYIKNNSNVKNDSLDYNYTQQYLAFGATFYLNF